MYSLTDKQIDFILNDIRRRGVEMEDLQYNLLDHICCIIEQNLEADGNFEDFYNTTIPKFFKHELWEIEEETINLLIFKHYYAMKKVMITAGVFGGFATLFGAFFKIMHWPGANVLLIFGLTSISLLFLPLMFSLKIKEKKEKKDKVILGIGSFVTSLIAVAAMFKIMHWPGTTIMLYTSLTTLIFLFLPVFFISGIKNPDTKTGTVVTSVLILAGTGLLLVLPKGEPSLRLSQATVNQMRNENATLQEIKSILEPSSLDKEIGSTYTNFMSSAEHLKDAIAKSISGVDFETYLMDNENINPSALTYTQLDNFRETQEFIDAVVALESKAKINLYIFDKNLGYDAPNRGAEIDYALMLQPHVKDLIGFIENLQTKATLSLVKR
jgi:hypothetical protein